MCIRDRSCFTSTETVGLLRTGAQDGHLDFHTAPELCIEVMMMMMTMMMMMMMMMM